MSLVKRLVSKKKKRFQQDGFDLDLSYVTPQVIAMGFPSSSFEGMYRNSMDDIKRFFKKYHEDHYKVYNLCAEKAYKPSEFGNSCVNYPFPDHNPCPFSMIISMMEDVHKFLAEDKKNAVAIHCKAGKGRTGMMISCYLLFSGEAKTANDALDLFGEMRTKNKKGVTIPSQQRYVRYFEFFLKHYYRPKPSRAFNFKGVPLKLTLVKMFPIANFDVGGGCDPYFLLTDVHGKNFFNYKKQKGVKVKEWRKEGIHELQCEAFVQGDIHVHFMDEDTLSKDDKMFGFWFHTSMVRKSPLVLTKNELDSAIKDTKCKNFPKNFYIELHFTGVPPFDEKEGDIPKPRDLDAGHHDSSDDEDDLDDQPPPPPPLQEGQVDAASAIIPPPPPIEDAPPPPPSSAVDVKSRPAGAVPPPPPAVEHIGPLGGGHTAASVHHKPPAMTKAASSPHPPPNRAPPPPPPPPPPAADGSVPPPPPPQQQPPQVQRPASGVFRPGNMYSSTTSPQPPKHLPAPKPGGSGGFKLG